MPYLNAMVTISKIVHWLKLLVDDTDASFMCPIRDRIDIFRALAHVSQLLIYPLSTLDCCLRMKLGYYRSKLIQFPRTDLLLPLESLTWV